MLLLLALACPDTVDCDLMAALSVSVSLVDTEGAPVDDAEAEVRYEAGGTELPCEDLGDVWGCGWEVAGEITVRASVRGYLDAEETVVVEQGECHVVQEFLTLALEEVDCTDEEVPSVLVTVYDEGGALLPAAQPAYVPHDEDWTQPEPCDPAGAQAQWHCGWEREGILDIWIDAEGYTTAYHEVDVPADECHVITTALDVYMAR